MDDWDNPYQVGWCGKCGVEIRRGDKGVPWVDEHGNRVCRDGYPHLP